ncbi:MAG TPA: L-2-amino-thiazoline-4-carboxylic acid hydrolase [Methylomirabilota bacterium]|nr:L-2-amino-thiazoline-4-carboxylic acid hydrolase [Methylomirabilota bacterium]
MLTAQTRRLLLEAGRRSIDVWVPAGRLSEPGLKSDAQAAYARMADKVPWPDQQINRIVLVFLLLPCAALYTALREHGRTEQEAVESVTRAALAGATLERITMGLLLRTAPGRQLFMRTAPHFVGLLFSAPAWQLTWVERSDDRVAFDITRCYALDTLRLLDAAPVTRAVCADDDYVFTDLCPHLRFTRTGTLATGAPRCDFCWERVQPERTPATPRQNLRRTASRASVQKRGCATQEPAGNAKTRRKIAPISENAGERRRHVVDTQGNQPRDVDVDPRDNSQSLP